MGQKVRKGKTPVTSERPGLTRSCRKEAERRASDERNENRRHHRRSCMIVCSVIEDLDEVVSSGCCQSSCQVADCERKGNADRKAQGSVESNCAHHTPRDDGGGILYLLGHMARPVIANEWQIGTNQSHKPRQSIAVPASFVDELFEHEGNGSFGSEDNEGNEHSEEAECVENENDAFNLRQKSSSDSVDENAGAKACPHQKSSLPPRRFVIRIVEDK